ncbi:protein polyglycylase TTLL10 [Dunckerocampus dactyliophorus]|uniref:protein polyglycylase TTLL10 n=1 Tax=Dunckerocampus dactyliophorus TaxID=161453 RepID=UPI0024069FDA|nr:protein polyglycylase TTLL10 [Dunckerocampus dactyliophorus]
MRRRDNIDIMHVQRRVKRIPFYVLRRDLGDFIKRVMSSDSMKPCNEAQNGELEKQEEDKEMSELLAPPHDVIQISEDGLMKGRKKEMQSGYGKRRFNKKRLGGRSGARQVGGLHKSIPRSSRMCSCRGKEMGQPEEELGGAGPFFFIGGANGAEIVSTYCEKRGWKRIYNNHRDDFKLKWCETKSPSNYLNFREGEQLVYQIPNNKVLTTKIGLLSSLREYERVSSKVNHGQALRRLKIEEFIPTTFRMDLKQEREAFFAQQEGVSNNYGQMWICKPTGLNQGRGIFLLRSLEDIAALKVKLQDIEDQQVKAKTLLRQPQAHVVQHYIQRPLLLKGKKFDVRSYLLIACTSPYMVFFHHGYVRLTCDLYEPSSNNLSVHLTNQYMQKKNPLYSQVKEDTVWSMESFNVYVNDRFQAAKGLPRDWVLGPFTSDQQARILTTEHARTPLRPPDMQPASSSQEPSPQNLAGGTTHTGSPRPATTSVQRQAKGKKKGSERERQSTAMCLSRQQGACSRS